MARTLIASDAFPSSIDSGWTNGPGAYDTMSWVSSGVINETAVTGRGAMVRSGDTYPGDQYSKAVVATLTMGAGFYADICATVLMQQSSAECYLALLRCSSGGDRFRLYESDSAGALTLLANTGTALDVYDADSYVVLENDGAGNLNFYAKINAGSEASVLTASDSTVTTGRPGLSANAGTSSAITDAQIKSWEGGSMGSGAVAGGRGALLSDMRNSRLGILN